MERLMKMLGQSKRGKAGFTLIELMIVVIIVGILAAAAVPIYTSYVKKSYRTEAEASLGAIRTAEIAYKAETGAFAGDLATLDMTSDDFAHNRYFSWACFDVTTGSPAYATCDGNETQGPVINATIQSIRIQMDLVTGTVSPMP